MQSWRYSNVFHEFLLHVIWSTHLLNTVFKSIQPTIERRAPVLNKTETVGMTDAQTFKSGKLWGTLGEGALHIGNARSYGS